MNLGIAKLNESNIPTGTSNSEVCLFSIDLTSKSTIIFGILDYYIDIEWICSSVIPTIIPSRVIFWLDFQQDRVSVFYIFK